MITCERDDVTAPVSFTVAAGLLVPALIPASEPASDQPLVGSDLHCCSLRLLFHSDQSFPEYDALTAPSCISTHSLHLNTLYLSALPPVVLSDSLGSV